MLKEIFANDETLVIREFQNKRLKAAKCGIAYIAGMVNAEMITENILKPILSDQLAGDIDTRNLLEELKKKVIVANNRQLKLHWIK